jgi:hypothetical protein
MAITYHSGRRIQSVPNEYKVHEFTSSGTFAVTGSGDVEYLVVAGGGGGYCGGGGAGGMRTGTLSVSAGNKTVTVGAGGYSGQCNVNGHGNNGVGGNSVFDSITSTGGGFGGGAGAANNTAGGSSGGAGGNYTANSGFPQSSVTPNQGNDGGKSDLLNSQKSGGGGGSGAVGGNAADGMLGGNGSASSISGSAVTYAGGGGGSASSNQGGTSGAGGTGGGGGAGSAGTVNLGGGGSGMNDSARAGYGGSGIVIVRYLTSSGITATGGTITTINAHDARPLNVQAGSRLEETNTRKMYYYADPLTFQDDFSSYANQTAADTAYPTTDSAKMRVNITNDNIDVDFERTGSNDLIYYDLGSGSVNDTKWVLRFKWVIDSVSSSNVQGCIGLASNTGSYHTSQDGVFLEVIDTSGANFRINDPNNALPDVSGGAVMTNTVSTGTRYVEIARTGATSATISFSSTSAYTKDTESKTYTIENVTGLRYFKIFNNSGGTTSGQVNGTIDDVEFYNGVTSTSNYWQEIGA